MAKKRKTSDHRVAVFEHIATETSPLSIFEPIRRARKYVKIITYGLAPYSDMLWVVKDLFVPTQILVGFDKRTHDPSKLKRTAFEYMDESDNMDVRLMPSMDIKLWVVDDRAFCGSANFVPSTIANVMLPVDAAMASRIFDLYWTESKPLTSTTQPAWLPQSQWRFLYTEKRRRTVL